MDKPTPENPAWDWKAHQTFETAVRDLSYKHGWNFRALRFEELPTRWDHYGVEIQRMMVESSGDWKLQTNVISFDKIELFSRDYYGVHPIFFHKVRAAIREMELAESDEYLRTQGMRLKDLLTPVAIGRVALPDALRESAPTAS